MPYYVKALIEGHPKPVHVLRTDSVQTALDRMIEYDYSQLAVIDSEEERKPQGIITSDSILRALNSFGLTTDKLRVYDAMIRTQRYYRPDDDIFDFLNDLLDVSVVLIIDSDGRLDGIVTSYDTTEYFRRRAEDIMFLRDIEGLLKDYVLAAFTTGEQQTDQEALDRAIEAIMPTNKDMRGPFNKALQKYLELQGDSGKKVSDVSARKAFEEHIYQPGKAKPFEELTLDHYIELFLHERRWERYRQVFSLPPEAIKKLLRAVQATRNALSHFRIDEASPQERAELRFCKEWLTRHEPAIQQAFGVGVQETGGEAVVGIQEPVTPIETPEAVQDQILIDDEISPDESRYARLAVYLQKLSLRQKRIQFTFDQIEMIIEDTLPASARQHRSWWANDSTSHMQSQLWLAVGWRVASINMAEERVIFARIKDREQAYIAFFSSLCADLRKAAPFPMRALSPDGASWITIARVPDGTHAGLLAFSFTRDKHFRVEFYIDSGDEAVNKAVFDLLSGDRDQVEAEVGEQLNWEDLHGRRASRIAAYHEGAITDAAAELAELRAWAVPTFIRLREAVERRLDHAYTPEFRAQILAEASSGTKRLLRAANAVSAAQRRFLS